MSAAPLMSRRLFSATALAGLTVLSSPVSAADMASCPTLLRFGVPRLQDDAPQDLCQYRGKVLLVVNTASFCGFTPQYEGLQKLHETYQARGFEVLGFPSNDFFQESASNKKIADFCEATFGIRFPMFASGAVKGDKAQPFYQALARAAGGEEPRWNFHKYLISRDGRQVRSFTSEVRPDDPAFIKLLEQWLVQR
jgi:glutathione peroxidase